MDWGVVPGVVDEVQVSGDLLAGPIIRVEEVEASEDRGERAVPRR